jgi:cell division protein FtsN
VPCIFTYAVFAAVIIGIILVVYAIVSIKKAGAEAEDSAQDPKPSPFDVSLDGAQAVDDLNNRARDIFNELESKHRELANLYDLIERTKAEEEGAEAIEEEHPAETFKNPKLGKIRVLYDQGMPEDEIAKTLGIGQGEVKLILSLSDRKGGK